MSKFEQLLNKGQAKLVAEKEVAKQLVNTRVKTLRTFAKDIYEFIEFVNTNYAKHPYSEGHGYRDTDIFEFSTYAMGFGVGNKFSIAEAKKWGKLTIVSHKLNNQIELECDEQFNIIASVGYADTKRFNTSDELIEHLAYLIAKRGIEKNTK